MQNEDWIERLRPDSENRQLAIEELRTYLVRGLTKALRHRYGGCVPVEDIVQESLLKILHSLETFGGRSQFSTWAMAIAIRTGISQLRRQYYRDVSLDQVALDVAVQIAPEEQTLPSEDEKERIRLFQLLETHINESLSEKQRQAIRGVLAGLPVEEIAHRLDSNRNAIYKLVHDAKIRLRREFESSGIQAIDIQQILS